MLTAEILEYGVSPSAVRCKGELAIRLKKDKAKDKIPLFGSSSHGPRIRQIKGLFWLGKR